MRFFMETVITVAVVSMVILSLMFLAGCAATPSGYPQDNAFTRLQDRQDTYCATTDPGRRAVMLALIRTQVPTYPDSGLCTDAEQVVFKELARQAASLPPVDVEQAREDQQRAMERLNTEE